MSAKQYDMGKFLRQA